MAPIRGGLVILVLVVAFAAGAQERPVNDDFADRIVLSGSSLIFTSTVTPTSFTTLEQGESASWFGGLGSVWWSWTAPVTGPFLVEEVENYQDPDPHSYSGIEVSSGSGFPPELIVPMWINHNRNLRLFWATAGTEYQIGLHQAPTLPPGMRFRLAVTNSPLLVVEPTPQTVTAGESALFLSCALQASPLYNGYASLRNQWQKDGLDLPEETALTLLVTNIGPEHVGDYRVVVSNTADGTVVTSRVARLGLIAAETRPSLQVASEPLAPGLVVTLTGDAGRYYQLQGTLDWSDWKPAVTNRLPTERQTTSVLLTNGLASVLLPTDGGHRFLRAVRNPIGDHTAQTCVMNLRQIDAAKELFSFQADHELGKIVSEEDLLPPGGNPYNPAPYCRSLPVCPLYDDHYWLQPIGESPTCYWGTYLPGHVLDEPHN